MNGTHELLYTRHSDSSYDIAFLTVADISEFIGMSKSKLYKDIREGKLIAEKNLDETTVISPRALQSAYPDIDVADLFELDCSESAVEAGPRSSEPPPALRLTTTDRKPSARKNSHSGLSSLEKALNKQSTDSYLEPSPANFANPGPRLSADETMVKSKDDDNKLNTQIPAKRNLNTLTAAIILASSILLVVLAVL